MNKLSLLIIDDDPEILEAVSLILKSQGHETRLANAEDEACFKELSSGQYKPDVIILDILLSGFDGRDFCRKLKASPQTKGIPIIMFSAYPNIEKSAKEAGADFFLPKPFGLRDLNYALKEVRGIKKIG